MSTKTIARAVAVQLGLAAVFGVAGAHAQNPIIPNIALKSGETQDMGPVYFVQNCRSIATAKPEPEILEGPADVTVTIREEDVVPRAQGCSNKIRGGILVVTAPQQIDDPSSTRLIIRIKYKTKEGERKSSLTYQVTLLP